MKFFIDTANVEEIREAKRLGLIDGVTTNPTLISKEGKDFRQLLEEITSIVDGPVSAEVVSTDAEGIIEEAKRLREIADNIVIKVPMIEEGLKATRVLTKELGIEVNMTLIFSPLQALLAAKAGATYISPFVGRLDDVSHHGIDLVRDILNIFDNYGFETQVIVASIRNPLHVLDAALMGADVATIPFNVLKQLCRHPLTDVGLERFLKDWQKVPKGELI